MTIRHATIALFFLALAVPSVASARTLSLGMSGSDVKALQQALVVKGYMTGAATGYFGQVTLAAVKKFQCEQQIVCSGTSYGLVGPRTQAALSLGAGAPPVQQGDLTGKMTPAATGAFEFSGWVPDWRAATATADVLPHLGQLKTVLPFAFEVSSAGHITTPDEFAKGPWPSLIAAARQSGVRVIPSILWGNGEEMHRVLSNSTSRIALEDEIVALVRQYNFDGIDIDFEAKKAETINYFSTFLKGLYQRMGNKWVYCTVEARMPLSDRYLPGQTIPPDATNYANDYVAMNRYCDRIEIMAYDQGTIAQRLNAARTAPYAPVADPGWVENIVALAAQSISRNKLIVGIPTYGYEYKVTPLGGGGFKYERQWAFNPTYALSLAAQFGVTPFRTSAGELGFTYTPPGSLNAVGPGFSNSVAPQQETPTSSVAQNSGSQVATPQPFNYVTWSDAQAIKDKIDLARRMGVRGVAIFSLSGGQDPAMWSLLK